MIPTLYLNGKGSAQAPSQWTQDAGETGMVAVADQVPTRSGIGVALSGGGFRATLFHLGALIRLNELGVLGSIDRFSSVSGGSILAGHLALTWSKLLWDNNNPAKLSVATNFATIVTTPVIGFCQRKLDIAAAAIGDLVPFLHASNLLEGDFRKYYYGNATLQDITLTPIFTFVSTNLKTGRTIRFSRESVADSRLGLILNPTFHLAEAVTASAAFPPFFTPYKLDVGDMQFVRRKYSDPSLGADFKSTLYLSDGGVYDNLGLEPVLDTCKVVLVSDAGSPLDPTADFAGLDVQIRVSDIMMAQGLGPRKRDLIQRFVNGAQNPNATDAITGAYWGIGTDITKYGLTGAQAPIPFDPIRARLLSQAGTQLRPFSTDVQNGLVNWGYVIADAAIRRWYTGTVLAAPPALPFP